MPVVIMSIAASDIQQNLAASVILIVDPLPVVQRSDGGERNMRYLAPIPLETLK